jgi:hypothetical protein
MPLPLLATLGIGLGAQLLGGLLGSIFQRKTWGVPTGDYEALLGRLLQQTPENVRRSLFSAAGTVGSEVRPAFETQLTSLTPSARALAAAGTLGQYGQQMLQASREAVQQAQARGERAVGEWARQAMATARQLGATSPAALSALMRTAGQQIADVSRDLATTGTAAVQQALAQAANIESSIPQLLEASRSARFATNVQPYMGQAAQGISAALVGALPRLSEMQESIVTQPFAGVAALLGSLGTQIPNFAFMNQMVYPQMAQWWATFLARGKP